jgi:proteasome lid subunit RPN8/RPN11
MSELIFLLPGERGRITLTRPVLDHIYRHAQRKFWQREAGGQLFSANPHEYDVIVDAITGPHPADQRRRHGWIPDQGAANRDRDQMYRVGHHPVGLWHTHPEVVPSPSGTDKQTAFEFLRTLDPAMTGFLLLTLGNTGDPPALSVWLACANEGIDWQALEPLQGIDCQANSTYLCKT